MPAVASRLLQSRPFWIFLVALSLLAAFAALQLKPLVDPGVDIDISFSRQQAVEAAQQFRRQQFAELDTARDAAAFLTDSRLLYYVQLEAGGVEAYQRLLPQVDAATHWWRVRMFTPEQERELRVDFSPVGERLGFAYKIPQNEPGAALGEAEARALAEAGANSFIGERFAAYKPLESRLTTQPSGRVDHSFTYEHGSLAAGEVRFRYELTVAGAALVAIEPGKFIPQAFEQRFGEIRTLNTQISQVATYVMLGLLGLGGVIGGGVWLHRREQLQYRRALPFAAVVTVGLAAAAVVNLPVAWLSYTTTASAQSFLVQQWTTAALLLTLGTLALAGIYAVAEGFTRAAFPRQPRLWDTLKPAPVASPEMAGRILGGYAWTGFFLLYALLFGLLRKEVLHWWQPTGIDFNPNILASWRPALQPIFNALQAGTWEECVFRAVPLSVAVLVGERYGMRKPLVLATLLLQAVVFAAGHANYPNLPGYSRVVELLLPALVFGIVYLRVGLLIAMLTHFEYDLVLMSFPIFVADSAGLWLDRVLVLLAGLAPLLVLVYGYWKQGALQPLAAEWRNGAAVRLATTSEQMAQPAPEPAPAAVQPPGRVGALFSPAWTYGLVAIGIAALAYSFMQPLPVQWPRQQISHAEALTLGEQYLAERNVQLQAGEWRQIAVLGEENRQSVDFVWRTSGLGEVQRLLGSYISEPRWAVTWRRFDGPVENRTESWRVRLQPDGKFRDLAHFLPEGTAGATLTAAEAQDIAKAWITREGLADATQLKEHAVQETKRPARTDWTLTYRDSNSYEQDDGSAVVVVQLAGAEVSSYGRSINVPEAFVRERQQEASQRRIHQAFTALAALGLLGCALVALFSKRQSRPFMLQALWPWLLLTFTPLVMGLLRFDTRVAAFSSTLPWNTQVLTAIATLSMQAGVMAVIVFFLAHTIHGERPHAAAAISSDFKQGAAVALAYVGLTTLLMKLLPSVLPPIAALGYAGYLSPLLVSAIAGLGQTMPSLLVLVVMIGLCRFNTTRLRQLVVLILAAAFFIATALGSPQHDFPANLLPQLLRALEYGVVYYFIRRQCLGAALVCLGAEGAFEQLQNVRATYAGAAWHAVLGMLVSLAVTYWLLRRWHRYAATPATV